ncbi:hypothetical protein [Actinomadura parmotrematis]|uniref:Glycolipid-binding domain-containing protein n=1 Tax=Actinomadura parmotrematis TaxID=2864039 RepID=A0ABS7FYS1_9ACTN|nr:hypothetical protein [Actinomadura parmotrematis]MBW8484583.1 hypothetical protein [Actinomadura parmotrematis]
MPSGTYLHLDGEIEETFQCAPGAGGWRYVGTRADGVRTDLVVDGRWRQIRVEVAAGERWVRGGVTGNELAWVRAAGGTGDEHGARAAAFVGESPAFLVAVARWLRLEPGAQRDVALVRLGGPSLAALTVRQRWRLADVTEHATETAPLPVERYEVADLETAEAWAVHLAGDVVLDAPGIELAALASPPNLVTGGA